MPFSTPEGKAALAAAVEEATSGLKTKNAELLDEVKTLKKGRAINPEDVAKLETKIDELTEQLTAAQKATKDATKAAETATKQLEAESGFTQKLLIDNGLTSELTKNGVTNPIHIKAAQAMLRAGVKIEADGESRVAKVEGKALADFVKEWAGGEEGKHFVTAANNTGGGAGGGGGKPSDKDLSKLSPTARLTAARAAGAKS